jgi:hypothetical protein
MKLVSERERFCRAICWPWILWGYWRTGESLMFAWRLMRLSIWYDADEYEESGVD